MAERSIYARTFVRAAEIVGGPYALAQAIHAPMGTLESWFLGEATPPPEYFLRAVEILLANGGAIRAPPAEAVDRPAQVKPPDAA
jgi:hypothetical protein